MDMQAQALSILQILKILHLFLVSGGNLWLLYHCQLNPQFYAYIVLYIPVLACSNQLQAAKTRAELVMLVDQLYQLVKSVCVLVLLYIPLSMMHIPGPCRHSITNDHLLQINHLINNHLRNGCSISYVFIEKRHLSSVCYVKAALPRVLDLLSVHFRYSRGSESALLVRSLQNLIHNIYSQRCVPPLNEQLEEDPVVFLKQFTDSPIQALQRAKEVLDIYLQLITQTHTNTSMDWSCAMEYSNYTTVVITELPRTHRTEATQVMLGQVEQDSSDLSFYKLGFTVLAVSGGIFLLITVSCLIHRKRFHQLRRQDMELDTWSDVSHIEFCSTAFNRMDLII